MTSKSEGDPSLLTHENHSDWLGRVLLYEEEMNRSDAEGLATAEFHGGILGKAENLPARIREKLARSLNPEQAASSPSHAETVA